MATLLIVDDDDAILQGVALILDQAGFNSVAALSGMKAIEYIDAHSPPELVILDVLMPICDGFEVCRHIRRVQPYIPVLMLSARNEVIDKVLGLESGADDYLAKPFDARELVARVHALLRRKTHLENAGSEEIVYKANNICLWPASHSLEVDARPLDLPPKEWALLELFMKHPNRMFGRETILNLVWGYDYFGDSRTVDVHIQRLRAHLAPHHADGYIQTIRGFGYRFLTTISREE